MSADDNSGYDLLEPDIQVQSRIEKIMDTRENLLFVPVFGAYI